MTALVEFVPLVGQHCPNAPTVAIEFWARRAAIDFCRRTLAHQARLASFNTVIGTPEYTLDCGTGLQVAKLLACRVNGLNMRLTTPTELDALPDPVTTNSTPEAAYLTGTSKLTLYPAPSAVVAVEVRVALEPTAAAAEIADDLFAQYAHAIAYGASAKLAMTPDGRDERLAAAMSAMFDDEIGRATAAAYFNRARSGPRATPTWC